MWKNKYILAGVGLLMLLLVGGGWWLWHGHQTKTVSHRTPGGPSQNVIPLGGQESKSDTGGLSVSAGGASNLGQLGGNQSGQSSNGASGSSNSQSSVNPAQFAQYDKYKDTSNALFGDIKKGDGAELTAGKKAAVYYKGWLTNGQLFDQSRSNSDGSLQPFIFTLGAHEVIPGWEQAIYGMKTGGSRLLIVPPAVGYGANGQGPIPPNAVLVFEVQLVQVQ
jgi:FKBP-type peptidyl-prolyl cis-trans isomerase